MLTLKFSVPRTSRLFNLRTLAKSTCPNEKSCRSQESFDERRRSRRSRCLDYKRALEKCPKENLATRCGKKLFPDNVPQPKCNWSTADDYRRAYEAIKIRSKKLTDLAEAMSILIVREMRNDIGNRRCDEKSHTRRILKLVDPRIVELSNLDPVCAMKKKQEVLSLNDRTNRELTSRDCETDLGCRSIECDLEKLTRVVKSEADASLALVFSCRKSQSPDSLMHCVEHSSREAAKILDDANDKFENRMTSLKKAKEEILEEDKKIFKEVITKYEKHMAQLLSVIVDCVREGKSRRR